MWQTNNLKILCFSDPHAPTFGATTEICGQFFFAGWEGVIMLRAQVSLCHGFGMKIQEINVPGEYLGNLVLFQTPISLQGEILLELTCFANS